MWNSSFYLEIILITKNVCCAYITYWVCWGHCNLYQLLLCLHEELEVCTACWSGPPCICWHGTLSMHWSQSPGSSLSFANSGISNVFSPLWQNNVLKIHGLWKKQIYENKFYPKTLWSRDPRFLGTSFLPLTFEINLKANTKPISMSKLSPYCCQPVSLSLVLPSTSRPPAASLTHT